ncbi:MAG: hypothetical protein CL940_10940 [Deltaproteobacteria bacterium]|nr:hypothetical protein [Deltaproteobacteria bacterium]
MRVHGACVAVIAALLVGLSAQALAASAADKERAEKLADIGYDHYDASDYEAASEAFSGAYRIHQVDKYILNQAKCMQKLGRPVDALRLFETGVRNHPKSALAGKVRKLVKQLRGELGETMAEVKLTSTPSGAAIFLDGAQSSLGKTPYATWLPFGSHSVRLSLPDHEALERSFVVEKGDPMAVQMALTKTALPGVVLFDAAAPGADIFINGKIRGVTPMRGGMELKPGTYDVVLRHPGHPPFSATIEVKEGAKIALNPEWGEAQEFDLATPPPVGGSKSAGGLHWASWTGLGVGVAGLALGALSVKAALDSATLAREETESAEFNRQLWESHKEDAQSQLSNAYVGFGLAAAGVTSAIVFEAFIGASNLSQGTVGVVQLAPGPSPLGASISGRF